MAARLVGLVRSCRPRQLLRNLLVFAAPAVAGVLLDLPTFGQVVVAFVAFGLAASGTYLVNDAHDAPADRLHPKKRHRPVAAGRVPTRLAYAVGGVLLLAGIAVALLGPGWQLPAVVATYVVATLAYSRWLKHVPILDLVVVASGFLLRAVGGAAAVAVPVSSWFLIVVGFGSLGVVAGKREAELRATDSGERQPPDEVMRADPRRLRRRPAPTRPALAHYSREFLTHVRTVTTTTVLVAYALWALAISHPTLPRVLLGMSLIPLTIGILRYGMLVDQGHGEEPEELVLRDPALLASGTALATLVIVGVYVG